MSERKADSPPAITHYHFEAEYPDRIRRLLQSLVVDPIVVEVRRKLQIPLELEEQREMPGAGWRWAQSCANFSPDEIP
jgi:hypothetical protein